MDAGALTPAARARWAMADSPMPLRELRQRSTPGLMKTVEQIQMRSALRRRGTRTVTRGRSSRPGRSIARGGARRRAISRDDGGGEPGEGADPPGRDEARDRRAAAVAS